MKIKRETHSHFSISVNFTLCKLNHVFLWLLLLFELPAFGTGQAGDMAPSPPAPDLSPFRQTISKRMAVVLIVLVCFFIFLAVVSFYARRCSHQSFGRRLVTAGQDGSNNRSQRRRGLEAAVIETFPTFVYSNVKGVKIGKGALECAICLCEFDDDETLRLLPKCSHVFHSDCIDAWLVSHSTCPVCRASLVPKPGDISFAALLNSDSGINVDGPGNRTHLNGSRNGQVIVQIAEDEQPPDVSLMTPNQGLNQSRPVRSRSAGWRLTGIFPRSHSTGHSLVQRGENYERFTLRLPEEARRELLNSNLNRARSCVALPRMQSSRQGYRIEHGKSILVSSRSGRSDWRTFFPMNPLFRKDGSRRVQLEDMNGNVDAGDRPFARLRPDADGQLQY